MAEDRHVDERGLHHILSAILKTSQPMAAKPVPQNATVQINGAARSRVSLRPIMCPSRRVRAAIPAPSVPDAHAAPRRTPQTDRRGATWNSPSSRYMLMKSLVATSPVPLSGTGRGFPPPRRTPGSPHLSRKLAAHQSVAAMKRTPHLRELALRYTRQSRLGRDRQ